MNFEWSADQTALRQATADFMKRLPTAATAASVPHAETWRACAAFGLQGMPFDPEYGGGGQDVLTTVGALEAAGHACRDGGLMFAIGAQMWSVQMPIARHGTDDQKHRYLGRLCSGEIIGAHAMSEPDSGSDAFALRTTATKRGDEYVLEGAKTFVTSAPLADVFVAFASIDRSLGALGVTCLLVDRETPGLTVGPAIEKMGLHSSPMAEVIFDGCVVPVAQRIGREGRGAGIFNDSMEWERACIMAPCLGAMQRQIERCTAHARSRVQFGRQIGDFQAVSHRIAAMQLRLDAARLLLYRAVARKQGGQSAPAEAAMAKLHTSEAWVQSCLDAIQLHGGYGYTTEYDLERELRDAVGGTLYSGTSEIQKNIIARALGL